MAGAWGTASAATFGSCRFDTRDDTVLPIPDAASLFEIAYTTSADWRAGGAPLVRARFSSAPQAGVEADPDESRRIAHACVGEAHILFSGPETLCSGKHGTRYYDKLRNLLNESNVS